MVEGVSTCNEVGVPDNLHSPELRLTLIPAGRSADVQLVSGPPVCVEDTAVIALLKVRVNGAPANARALGATSLTVNVTDAEFDPPELL